MKENPYSGMDGEAYRIAYLIAGFLRNTLTEPEHDELDDWVNADDRNMQLFEDLTDEDNLQANLAMMDKVKAEKSFQALQQAGAFQKSARRFQIGTRPVWIAAASVILLVGIFFLFRLTGKNNNGNPEAATAPNTAEIRPGGNRATLTLTDGSVIDLTAAKSGVVINDSASHVNKPVDGVIVYDMTGGNSLPPSVHTLSTPVGGQYQVTLSDGTRVWLNAATTLKYPVRFAANSRNVEVTGEAYFEVAKNEKAPFTVLLSDSATVSVIGTHFNVMSYKEEEANEVTLLEGSVVVKTKTGAAQLKPGMQASIRQQDIHQVAGVDTAEITGWKAGLFVFHDSPIEAIMRQVQRWYDVSPVYKSNTSERFNATISRNEPLPKLLRLLELTGKIHFKTENKTVYVLP